jgi:hypothetical protein
LHATAHDERARRFEELLDLMRAHALAGLERRDSALRGELEGADEMERGGERWTGETGRGRG